MKILKIILDFKRSTVDTEIDAYKEYLIDINNLASTEKDNLTKMVKEIVSRNPEDAADIYEHYSEQFNTYNYTYVQLSNNGALVNAYSFFEHQLKDICRSLNKFIVTKSGTYKHVGNLSYAENIKNEIYAITGIDFTALDSQWSVLDNYREVRNLIAHNGANIIKEEEKPLIEQKKFAVVSSFAEIKLNADNGDFYIEDKELVAGYLDLVGKFLKDLIGILDKLEVENVI